VSQKGKRKRANYIIQITTGGKGAPRAYKEEGAITDPQRVSERAGTRRKKKDEQREERNLHRS